MFIQEMTGRLLKPKSFGEKDINSLLVALSHFDVLRMEYRGAGELGLCLHISHAEIVLRFTCSD